MSAGVASASDRSSSLKLDVSSGCMSHTHWAGVIATRRILPLCAGQERRGGVWARKKVTDGNVWRRSLGDSLAGVPAAD